MLMHELAVGIFPAPEKGKSLLNTICDQEPTSQVDG